MSTRTLTTSLLLAALLVSLPANASAQGLDSNLDIPKIQFAVGYGVFSFKDPNQAPLCARLERACQNGASRNALYGGTFEFARNLTTKLGISGQLGGYGHKEDQMLFLFIGPRFGRFTELSSGYARPALGHAYGELQLGVGGLASAPGGQVIKIGGGMEAFFPCARVDRGRHCSVGFDAGYRAGLNGHRELSGFQGMLRFGIGLGS